MSAFYVHPPFVSERQAEHLDAMLDVHLGDDHYPGDSTTSPHWPGVAPGTRGMNNAISPKYCNLAPFSDIAPRPPVLWVRGADDQIVSDLSMFDFGALGQLGAVPGWPGDDVCPPQPMISQLRHVLDAYASAGGAVSEHVLDDCAHSPHIEKPEQFLEIFHDFLASV